MIRENRISDVSKVVPFGRSSQFYFSRAMREYERGNLRRVCELLTSAIKYNPEDIWNYYNLALTHEELGEYETAISIWHDEVLKRDKSFSEAYFHLAVCYAETEDIDLVYSYMEKYLELEPNGDLETAARHILKLLEDSRTSSSDNVSSSSSHKVMLELEKKLAGMINTHAYDEALKICEQTLATEGESLPLLNRTTLICFLAGEEQKGLDYVQSVLAKDKNNVGAYCNLIFYYYQKGDDLRVQAIIEKVIEIEFSALNEVLRWTQTLGTIGKHKKAYEWLRDVYWGGEYNAEMLYQLGVAAINLRKEKDAKFYWRQAALLDDIRSPAELYYQLLVQIKDLDIISAVCSYNYDWPLINMIQSGYDSEVTNYTEDERQVLYICMKYYIRYGTPEIVNMVLNCIPALNKDMQKSIIQELMLSTYDDMKYHVLEQYDPSLNNITVIKSGAYTYQLDSSYQVKVTMPFIVAARMIKENLEAYQSQVIVSMGMKLWDSYCNKSYPNPRRISKSTVWAAAMECHILQMFNFDCDFQKIARRYGIKVTSLKRSLECIKETIIIK